MDTKTLVQCDFDNTITDGDVSFLLLEAFADGDWRGVLEDYRQGKISVGQFNTNAFAMIKADEATLVDFVRRHAKVRAGLTEMVGCCRKRNFEFVVVSNGLDFYIKTILGDAGLNNIKVFAARTKFSPAGLDVHYFGPNGSEVLVAFKDAHLKMFLKQGYQVVYIGDGLSDIGPARLAHHVLARSDLLRLCREEKLNCMPFDDLRDIARDLERY